MTTTIAFPEYLQLPFRGGAPHYGCDQDWFRGFWQRKAGCGPCTGANILYYLARGGRLRLPVAVDSQDGFLSLMEHSWAYLTPTMMGLNSPALMQKGLDALLSLQGSGMKSQALEVPAEPERRPSAGIAEAFIRSGLAADSPVAFLNLSNGEVPQLENWHWVTVVGLSGAGEDALMEIYDNGRRLSVPLGLWLRTTKRGGGFVYVA